MAGSNAGRQTAGPLVGWEEHGERKIAHAKILDVLVVNLVGSRVGSKFHRIQHWRLAVLWNSSSNILQLDAKPHLLTAVLHLHMVVRVVHHAE